jgi:hypothetical protein
VTIGFGLGVLLTLDLNSDKFLCIFSWVHNSYSLPAGDVIPRRPSII